MIEKPYEIANLAFCMRKYAAIISKKTESWQNNPANYAFIIMLV